jgi:type I restriction enzyme S subunit
MTTAHLPSAYELPNGWASAHVGDILSLQNGFAFKPSHWHPGGLPIIRIQNLNDPAAPFNLCSAAIPDRFRVNNGDLLFAWSGTPGTSFGAHIWKGGDAWLNQHIFRVAFNRKYLDPRFLQLAINQNLAAYITAAHGGAGLAHITKGKFEQSSLRIAPSNEQIRIVAEIEKQFTRLDDAVAGLQRVQADLTRYRASVLKAACEGRLVPTEAELARKERRDYEPASELLKRILFERRAKWEVNQLQKMVASGHLPNNDEWKNKYREPEALDLADVPKLPRDWAWISLEQLSHFIRNGISAKPDEQHGVPILRISAVRPMSVDLNDVRFLPQSDEFKQFVLSPNDLLFTRYNGNREYVGVCGRVKQPPDGLVHPDKLIRVVPVLPQLAPWIEIASNVGFSRAFLTKRIRTTAGQSGVSGEDLKRLPIPLCPEAEATRIAAEVDLAITSVQATALALEASLLRAERTRSSILKKAFEGKLVPQDPNDEPASVLLERIRAERASAQATNNNHKGKTEATTANTQRRRRGEKLAQPARVGKR